MKQKITGSRELGYGKFLYLRELEYTDHRGLPRKWESCDRTGEGAGCFIFAKIVPDNEVLLIRQYRPPLDRFAIEFPAGLIDDGEEPGEAALRELREETGYKGELKKLSDRAYSSPGLTDEFLIFARVEIDPAVQGEIQTDFDEAESIETFLVAPDKLNEFLENVKLQ